MYFIPLAAHPNWQRHCSALFLQVILPQFKHLRVKREVFPIWRENTEILYYIFMNMYVWMYIYTYVYIYTYLFHHLGGYQHSMSKPHCWWRRLSQTNPAYRWSPPAFYENATSTHLHLLESRGCTDQAKIWIWKPTLSNIILSRQPHVTTKQVDFSILSHAFLCC